MRSTPHLPAERQERAKELLAAVLLGAHEDGEAFIYEGHARVGRVLFFARRQDPAHED
jgi:hypothetical protein